MTEPIIRAEEVVKSFGEPPLTILKSVSFNVDRGEFVAITGRSGSGKSTLFYVVSGLDGLTGGQVCLDGKNIHTIDGRALHRFRNERMGFVFQFHYLLPELTALENILMPARKARREREKHSRALELLDTFEIPHCRDKYPSQMSGGEQQRVSIARALIMEPDILFADEPTGNLDSVNGRTVMKIFREINRTRGTTIMLITHEEDYARRATRRMHMVDGIIEKDSGGRI